MGRMGEQFRIRVRPFRLWLQTQQGRVAVSTAVHLLALFLVTNAWWIGAHRLRPAGTRQGVRPLMTYNPGKLSQTHEMKRPLRHRLPPRKVVEAPKTIEARVDPPGERGNEALGEGNVSLAYVQAFPAERPDLSDAGATADIYVDLQIDDTGHIIRVHARRGIGRQVDQMVVATVEQWVFHPAVKNGRPVSSEQELHFHFDRRRNPGGCGWECITLEAD
ncbi:energy transducer TonB [Terriglobus tenax]|uniref:energy transducer TonB n=1 Tax=Terriglobus tenax TaxID=1111115 RepID=UPI0021E01ECE|nr:energy transducer TonB [Terriglobus tenax]